MIYLAIKVCGSEFQAVVLAAKTTGPRGLRVLSGRRAEDTVKQLMAGISALKDPKRQDEFEKICEPNKGWGRPCDALECLESYAEAAVKHPDFIWEIH